VSDTRDEVKRRFGAAAEKYVQSPDHSQGESLDRLIELLLPEPGFAAWRALDVATGGGHTALAVARHVREVVATDLTVPMLGAAKHFIRAQGVTNVRFQEADAGALPFAADSFDLVTCRIAPHHFPDCAAFVRESARVTRPGGLVAVIDNIVPEDRDADAFVNSFEKIRDPSHNRAHTEREWRGFFVAAGLTIEHAERYRKARDFARWIAIMSVDDATRERLRAMLLGATGEARAALQPEGEGEALQFYLGEILLMGRR
jgi:ubiquinone/menaquinone biosynthesis C-methylase UbiE